jgi:hypothetical protein
VSAGAAKVQKARSGGIKDIGHNYAAMNSPKSGD